MTSVVQLEMEKLRQNCWQVKACGWEAGGKNSKNMEVCPATTSEQFDGMNGGKNGGRICWAVAGTLCGGEIKGTCAQNRASCLNCEFFLRVKQEEGSDFQMLLPDQTYHPGRRKAS